MERKSKLNWLVEILESNGIDEANISSIEDDVAKSLPRWFVPKTKYAEQRDENAEVQASLEEAQRQIEGLKINIETIEGEKAEINGQLELAKEEAIKEYKQAQKVDTYMSETFEDAEIAEILLEKNGITIEFDENGEATTETQDKISAFLEQKPLLAKKQEETVNSQQETSVEQLEQGNLEQETVQQAPKQPEQLEQREIIMNDVLSRVPISSSIEEPSSFVSGIVDSLINSEVPTHTFTKN